MNFQDRPIKRRLQSFMYAFQGVRELFRDTPNARIELLVAAIAIILGVVLRISTGEWIAIVILIGVVFAMEAINTAIETLADYACDGKIHPAIRKAKDLAAAGVLLVAIASLVVGFIIFLPKIF